MKIDPVMPTDEMDDEAWSAWAYQTQVAHARRERRKTFAVVAGVVVVLASLLAAAPALASDIPGCGGG